MSYQSERHRRKVMREMRLAGYDLPGSPYQRKNRKFAYHNKRTGVSTGKVKTSKKTITGKRSTKYVKYNWNPNPQQRAMFAAMMAKKADGTYVPSTKEDGTYTREDKKWNEWIAGGKKGPSPYELKHPQMMQALGSSTPITEEDIIKNKMKEIKLREIEEAKNTPIPDSHRRHLKESQSHLKTMDDVYKQMLEDDYRLMNKPVPPEGSEQYIKDYLNEKQEYTDRAKLMEYDDAMKSGDFKKAGRIGKEWVKLVEKKYGSKADKFIKDAGSQEELSRRSMEINTPIVERKIYQKAKDETLAERIALRPKKEPVPVLTAKPIVYTQPENVKTEADRRRDIKAQGIEEKKSTPKKPKWVDTRKQKYHRRKKPYHRKRIKKAKKVRKRSTTHQLSSGMRDMTLVAGGAILGAAIVNKKVLSK